MKSSTMTVRMELKTRERLSRLADAVNRSKSYILNQAIREYLDTMNGMFWKLIRLLIMPTVPGLSGRIMIQ